MAKYLLAAILMGVFCTLCTGSAIPMWEFLSRGEKMSHLYSMFAKQVSTYCKINIDLPVTQCKRDLLVYGVDKLEKMSDSHLDAMDPYQRGANDIIWDSMMKGHPKTGNKNDEITPSPIREPTGQYEKNPLFDDRNDTPKRSNSNANNMNTYAADMDQTYGSYPTGAETSFIDPQNYLGLASSVDLHYDLPSETVASTTNFLSGPMVIRVRPDGTPVEEDKLKPLPRDDDREAMTIGKNKLPTAQQITDNFNGQQPVSRRAFIATYRTIDRRIRNSH